MMGWYKRASRFVCDALGNTGVVGSKSRISHNLVSQNVLKNKQRNNLFVDGKVHFFKSLLPWIGSGIVIGAYFNHMETVPYTRRRHFLLCRSYQEKSDRRYNVGED